MQAVLLYGQCFVHSLLFLSYYARGRRQIHLCIFAF